MEVLDPERRYNVCRWDERGNIAQCLVVTSSLRIGKVIYRQAIADFDDDIPPPLGNYGHREAPGGRGRRTDAEGAMRTIFKPSRDKEAQLRGLASQKGYTVKRSTMSYHWPVGPRGRAGQDRKEPSILHGRRGNQDPEREARRMNINSGKLWSAMDLFDLKDGVEHGDPIEEIAEYLRRDVDEVIHGSSEDSVLRSVSKPLMQLRPKSLGFAASRLKRQSYS